MKLNNIIKSKVKEFIIVFIKVLAETLLAVFLLAFGVVPCIIVQTGSFIILWIIFITLLYITIWFVFFDPFKEIKNTKIKIEA